MSNHDDGVDDQSSKIEFIRNLLVCGDFESGKTTLTNYLVNNPKVDENTFKSQFYYCKRRLLDDDLEYSINLIDCPGRVELSSEMNTSLRLSDGCLLMTNPVGYGNSLGYYSEMILRQACKERIRSAIFINKLDVLLISNNLEELYKTLEGVIESVNVVICTYSDEQESAQVSPKLGTVAFGAANQGWAFTLKHFGKFYSKRFDVDEKTMISRLWGENYYNTETNEWLNHSCNGKLERSFCEFILKPIRNMLLACKNSKHQLRDLLQTFGVEIADEILKLENDELISSIMQQWIPASECVFNMIIHHLPSPKKAQKYRTENLYTGILTDNYGIAIQNCEINGPLMMYITKSEIIDGKVYAVGRIFSGTLNMETQIRIIGPRDSGGLPKNIFEDRKINGIVKINGSTVEPIEEATCGLIVGLVGIEKFITNEGATITENENVDVKAFTDLKTMNVSTICVSIEPERQVNLPTLIKGMQLITNCNPSLNFSLDEYTGEKILTFSSDLHLKSILREFEHLYPNIELTVSEPVVRFQEGVTRESDITLVKSPNKHNRLWLTAEPLSEDLCCEIEKGNIPEDIKTRAKFLNEQFGWDLSDARKIWALGPERNSPNMLIDQTIAVQYLGEIKDASILGFQNATREGPLCGETLRGVRINIKDVIMVSDSIHRAGGQIIPTMKRGCTASILGAGPTLIEPVFLMEYKCKQTQFEKLYEKLIKRRCIIMDQREHGSIFIGSAYLPIRESFGLSETLNKEGIFSQFIFDHWESIQGDISTGNLSEIISEIRHRKGLPQKIPTHSELSDKL